MTSVQPVSAGSTGSAGSHTSVQPVSDIETQLPAMPSMPQLPSLPLMPQLQVETSKAELVSVSLKSNYPLAPPHLCVLVEEGEATSHPVPDICSDTLDMV